MNVLSRRVCLFILFANVFVVNIIFAQGLSDDLSNKVEKQRTARIMFYNCENLFDIYDDTLVNDSEFMPEGNRHWSKSKYYDKLDKVSKVITAIGGWSPPELVGLCEVENSKVLFDLIMNSPLYHFSYKVIHKESPDKRGIDVALLYQPNKYSPIYNRYIEINFPDTPWRKTRDILYSKGVLAGNDTIHIFVNHWPSRWGGQLESEKSRVFVASVLKQVTDSIDSAVNNANIIIIGDFNDTPTNKSISKVLNVSNIKNTTVLYNMSNVSTFKNSLGTIKYRGKWSVFDQVIVSKGLTDSSSGLFAISDNFIIFSPGFLLENDNKYLGQKPFRTFVGYKYNGGYSDHLPIFIDLNKH